jgi:hypothetical protein
MGIADLGLGSACSLSGSARISSLGILDCLYLKMMFLTVLAAALIHHYNLNLDSIKHTFGTVKVYLS